MSETRGTTTRYKVELANGNVDFANFQFKVDLIDNGVTIDASTEVWPYSNSIDMLGDDGSGELLGAATITEHTGDDPGAKVQWPNVTIVSDDIMTFRHVVLYCANTNVLIAYKSYSQDIVVPAGEEYVISNIYLLVL
jgi:hypothetical protein